MTTNRLIYLPSAVKYFRRLAEAWREEARQLRQRAKTCQDAIARDAWTARADICEEHGKELKKLASDVLNGRFDEIGIL